jgi:hypothetical protein
MSSNAADLPAPTVASYLNAAALSNALGNFSGVNISFSALPGSALGQTFGSRITLDPTAAGHGWTIDSTPLDNSVTTAGQNPYANMNAVLGRLGVNHSNWPSHHNHFHVNLRPPQSLAIGARNFLADALTA